MAWYGADGWKPKYDVKGIRHGGAGGNIGTERVAME